MKNKINILIVIFGLAVGAIGAKFGISMALGLTLFGILGLAILMDYERSIILLAFYVLIDFGIRNVGGLARFGGIWDELLFLGLVALFIYKMIRYKRSSYKWTPLDFPIMLFIIVGIFLVCVNSPNIVIAIEGLRAVVQYILWYFVVVQLLDTTKKAVAVYWVITSIGALLGLHACYQFVTGAEMLGNWTDSAESIRTRAFSIVGSPNILGSIFVLCIPLAIGLVTSDKNNLRKIIAVGMTLVMGAGLLFTFSRGAWGAAAFGVCVFIFYKNKKLLLPLILCGLIGIMVVPQIADRISYMLTSEYSSKSKVGGRMYRWEEGLNRWSQGNKAIGLGLGRFGGAVATNHKLSPFYMDNYYIKTLVEMGYIGFIAFILLLICVIRWCSSAIKLERNARKRDLMMGLFAGVLGIMFNNATENIFEVPMMVTYFWICIGLIMVLKMDKGSKLKANHF